MCDDDWVNLAISDDSVVVNLLLLLHQPPSPSPHLHLHWTVRQRRSRSLPRNKPQPTTSPTTPLSWSGATSASGGAVDVYDDTRQRNKHAEMSRSKISNPSETTTTKKSKRKKTLAELKEEENLLLQERRSLKNELASLRVTVEKHRAANESLKRMKLDLESRQNSKTAITTIPVSGKLVSPKTIRHKVLDDDSAVSAANAAFETQEIGNHEYTFELPDLNLAVEENLSSNTMH